MDVQIPTGAQPMRNLWVVLRTENPDPDDGDHGGETAGWEGRGKMKHKIRTQWTLEEEGTQE